MTVTYEALTLHNWCTQIHYRTTAWLQKYEICVLYVIFP